MARMNMTNAAVAKLKPLGTIKPGSPKQVWYSDNALPSLRLCVGERALTFYVAGRVAGAGIVRRVKLGSADARRADSLTATAARRKAGEVLDTMRNGHDPKHKPASPAAYTIRQVLDDYTVTNIAGGRMSEATAHHYRGIVANHCWPDRDITSIRKADDVKKHFDDLTKAGKRGAANEFLSIMRRLFRHAIEVMDIEIPKNPTLGIKAHTMPKRAPIDDLRIWYTEVMKQPPMVRDAFLLGALTGIRHDNLTTLKWADIDFAKKTIFLAKTKTARNVTLPASDEALRILHERKVLKLSDEWVFPSPRGNGSVYDFRADNVPGVFHSTRSIFTTAGTECELPEILIERLRGDKGGAKAMHGYVQKISNHEGINKIAAHVMKQWR